MAPKQKHLPLVQSFRQQYAYGQAYVDASKLVAHSKVRKPLQEQIQRVIRWIKRDGWIPTSMLYVQEMTPEQAAKHAAEHGHEHDPLPRDLESVVQSFRSLAPEDFLAQRPEGMSIKAHPKFGYLTEIIEDNYEARWYNIIDGAHRAAAAVILAEEWRAEGRNDEADMLLKIPVILMKKDMPVHTMVQFASMVNHSNENFVVTSNLNQMTALKRSYQIWREFVVKPQIAEIRLAEEQADMAASRRMSAGAEAQMSGDVVWVKYAQSEAEACNQTLAEVYGRDVRTLEYWIGTARYLSEEVQEHLHVLYGQDVRIHTLTSYSNRKQTDKKKIDAVIEQFHHFSLV